MVKRVYSGNDVLPPKSSGQIPVATPNSNNRLVYAPITATLPTPQASDVGKILAINTVAATGVTYKYEALTPIDPLLLSIYNQNGILGIVAFAYSTSVVTINAQNATAIFYNPLTQVRTSRSIVNNTITITTTGDSTYLFVKPDGTFGQVHSTIDPADFKTVNYLCKIYHPNSGAIVSVKPVYTILDHPQENLRDYGYGLGIMAQNFHITVAATGTISQTSSYAVVSGYNINPADAMPSQRLFPTTTIITFQYWAWVVADRVASVTNVFRTYKLDNPSGGTSGTIPAGQVGIVLMFAGSDGSYIFLAPQLGYANRSAAITELQNYVGSAILPQLLVEQYDVFGAIIVQGNVTNASQMDIVMLNSLVAGGAPKDDLLPAPTTAGVVKVLAGTNAYSIQPDVPTPAVDLTGFVNGDILGVTAGKIAPVKSDVIFPVATFSNGKEGCFRVIGNTVSHITGELVNIGITMTVTDLPGGGGVKQIIFSGLNNFWLHSGFYENSSGQVTFGAETSTISQRYFDMLRFTAIDPMTFSDNTQGFRFRIIFFLL